MADVVEASAYRVSNAAYRVKLKFDIAVGATICQRSQKHGLGDGFSRVVQKGNVRRGNLSLCDHYLHDPIQAIIVCARSRPYQIAGGAKQILGSYLPGIGDRGDVAPWVANDDRP